MSFLLEKDSLNGKAGKAFVTINGRNEEVFGLKMCIRDSICPSRPGNIGPMRRSACLNVAVSTYCAR